MKTKNSVPKVELSALTGTEFLAENVTVHGKNCVGCQRWDRDIMVSFMDKNKSYDGGIGTYFDLFLTTEQAIRLRDGLTKELKRNDKE